MTYFFSLRLQTTRMAGMGMRNLRLLRGIFRVIGLSMLLFVALPVQACDSPELTLEVTATAYASDADGEPAIAAWGDRLKPGMNVIAVSRDLLRQGICAGDSVRIEGLEGTFRVLDKMNKRWKRRIDIYMGHDREAALDWGKRKVLIHLNDESA